MSTTDQLLNRTVELMNGVKMPEHTPFVCLHLGNGQWKQLSWGMLRQSITVQPGAPAMAG
jgi:hypothetical protein